MSAPTARRLPGQAKVVSLIGAGHCFSHLSSVALAPIFPLIRESLGLSYVALGSLVAVFAISGSVAQIPVGMLVDRIGGRTILVLGLLTLGGALAAAGAADSYWHLAALMALAGLGNSVFHPADYAILTRRIDGAVLGRVISLHSFVGYVGWAIAPATMLGLTAMFGWRGALLGVGLIGIAVAALIQWQGEAFDTGRPPPARRAAALPLRERLALGRTVRFMLSAPMLALFGFFFLTSMAISGVTTFVAVIVMATYGLDREAGNFVLTAFLVAMAAGVLAGGIAADRTSSHDRLASVTMVGAAAFLALAGFGPGGYGAFVAVIGVGGFLLGISSPSRDMLVRAASPPETIGLAFGYTSTGLSSGFALGPVAVGWLMDMARPDLGLLLMAGLCIAAVATVALPTRRST